MKATVSYFELPAEDLDRAAGFYRQVFGWDVQSVDWPGWPYLRLTIPAAENGLQGGLVPAAESGIRHPLPVIHLSGLSLEDCLQRIVDAGGRVDSAASQVAQFGRFARFRDPEGNLLGLWEAANPAAPDPQR